MPASWKLNKGLSSGAFSAGFLSSARRQKARTKALDAVAFAGCRVQCPTKPQDPSCVCLLKTKHREAIRRKRKFLTCLGLARRNKTRFNFGSAQEDAAASS